MGQKAELVIKFSVELNQNFLLPSVQNSTITVWHFSLEVLSSCLYQEPTVCKHRDSKVSYFI